MTVVQSVGQYIFMADYICMPMTARLKRFFGQEPSVWYPTKAMSFSTLSLTTRTQKITLARDVDKGSVEFYKHLLLRPCTAPLQPPPKPRLYLCLYSLHGRHGRTLAVPPLKASSLYPSRALHSSRSHHPLYPTRKNTCVRTHGCIIYADLKPGSYYYLVALWR